jgi:DNA-binding transcriptional LysR family regulator
MEVTQLKMFVSVANTLNFSLTAERFFLTQPAISHQIKILEEELGAKLFLRSSHHVSLTDEGKEFLHYATQVLDLLETAENRIQNMVSGRNGYIRIASLSSASDDLSECLAMLHQNYPDIQIDVDLIEGTDMLEALIKHSYDFYFAVDSMVPPGSSYRSLVIREEQLHLFVHRLDLPSIDMSDWSTIEKHPFISMRQSEMLLSSKIKTVCRNRGCVPQIINYYNRAESIILSVNSRIGITILLPNLTTLYFRPNVVAIPIDGEDAKLKTVFVWEPERTSAACQIFKQLAIDYFNSRNTASS